MEFEKFIEKGTGWIGVACAWFVTCIGLFWVLCWQFGLYFSLSLSSGHWLVPYLSALSLALSGLSFLAIIYLKNSLLQRVAALLVFLLVGIRFLEILFHLNLGLSAGLAKTLLHPPQEFPSTLLIGAINFVLLSLLLFCWPQRKRTIRVSAFLTCGFLLAFFISVACICINMLPIPRYYLDELAPSHSLIEISQVILAIGLISWNFYLDFLKKIGVSRWFPTMISGGLLVFNFLFFLSLLQEKQLSPSEALRLRNVLLFIVATGGTLVSLFSGVFVHLYQINRERKLFAEKAKEQFQVSNRIMKAMNEADTIPDATQKILEILHEVYHWELLLYWQWSPTKKIVELVQYNIFPGCAFPNFELASKQIVPFPSTLAGEVFRNTKALWYKDYGTESFERSPAALKDGIKGALALPIFERADFFGILELFRIEPIEIEPEETWLEFMRNLASEFLVFIERREAENIRIETHLALEKSEGKFRSFVETTNAWIWEMDLACQYTYSNPMARKILGYEPESVVGKKVTEFAVDEDKIAKEMVDCIQNRKGWKLRLWRAKAKNETVIWLESNGDPIFNEKKELIGFRGADRDVTERINVERSKNEFISMVSHELRTPLTSIVGALGLLSVKEEKNDEETKELISLANKNANRLTAIINDILDVEKIQLGRLHLELKSIVLIEVLREAIQLSQPFAAINQVPLIEEEMLPSVRIYADYDRLVQVMLNLLSNAIKFSPPGKRVVISMKMRGQVVRVSVQDQGFGVPFEAQGKIFEKFTQAEGGDARMKGTGLGLSISKSIVEQMGGRIQFVSKPNKGSTFYFEFPIFLGA